QQRQAQTVDANVVVLPERSVRTHRTRDTLVALTEVRLAEIAVVVDRVGLAEHAARPLARLLQHLSPRDAAVLHRRELAVGGGVAHAIVDASNEPTPNGDACERREIALRDAEGHLHARGLAPLPDETAAAHDEAARASARTDRPEHAAGALGLVGDADEHASFGAALTTPPRLVSAVIRDRHIEAVGGEAPPGRGGRPPAVRRQRGHSSGARP